MLKEVKLRDFPPILSNRCRYKNRIQ